MFPLEKFAVLEKKHNQFDVLFCCNDDSEDELDILKIFRYLEEHDIVPWHWETDARPGDDINASIIQQMQETKKVAVCFGINKASESLERLIREFLRNSWDLIPVFWVNAPKELQLPQFLGSLAPVDFRDSYSSPSDQLIRAIKGTKGIHA